MPRIITGRLGGRRIPSPPTSRTRPTSDRVRESIFNTLDAWDVLEGAVVGDFYAGTGTLGFEAISRGARTLTAIEMHPGTARAIGASAKELGISPSVRVFAASARASVALITDPLTLLFADPPYSVEAAEIEELLRALVEAEKLADEATLVIERSTRSTPLRLGPEFVHEKDRKAGDTRVDFFTFLDPRITEGTA